MIDIVIPYIIGPDNGLELKYALRSFERYFKDEYKISIIGEIPDWCVNVYQVNQAPIQDNMPFVRFRDTLAKLHTACNTPEISADFIYTYDDIYLLKDTFTKDLLQPLALADKSSEPPSQWFISSDAGPNWKKLLGKTLLLLKEEKKTMYNCETHTPRYYNKERVLKLFKKYGLLTNPYMFSSLYINNYYRNIKVLSQLNIFKAGLYQPMKEAGILRMCRNAKVLNVGRGGYDQELKSALNKLFPEPSKFEVINSPKVAVEKSSVREQYPFLNKDNCPQELKILVSDKISAYYNYVETHPKLSSCSNKKECYEKADTVITNFVENRLIHDELNHYLKSGKVLGRHPIFEEMRAVRKLKEMPILQLYQYYEKLKHRIWRNEDELKKNRKPYLKYKREQRKNSYNRELQECKKLLNIYE
jgi:hypothetical protein